MKKQLLFLLLLMVQSNLWAQDSTIVTINAGSSIKEVLGPSGIFLYPQFINGLVFFRDETKAAAMMNYNSLDDQMLFIDNKGDTLAIKDEQTIKFIAVEKDTFFYNEGYIRLLEGNKVVKLAEKQTWELIDIRKMGTHNRPSTTFAITSFSTVTDRFGKSHELLLNEDLVLRKKATYYFGDRYNHFALADKKNLLMLFPKQQNSLSAYLKVNNVKFGKKDDLEKITRYLAQNN